ncbi:MAG: hypothetical protein ACYC7A_07445 [Thermoanaerobaculia bacterium]
MTRDEERLCRSYHRPVFHAWMEGEVSFEDAVYLTRRREFCWLLYYWRWPEWLVSVAAWFWDRGYAVEARDARSAR